MNQKLINAVYAAELMAKDRNLTSNLHEAFVKKIEIRSGVVNYEVKSGNLDKYLAESGSVNDIAAHIKRITPQRVGMVTDLTKACEFVMANLPFNVKLNDEVVIERYPVSRSNDWLNIKPAIFSYQFMTEENLNIATWIPDVSNTTLNPTMITGFEGRGREFNISLQKEKRNIHDIIDYIEGRNYLLQYHDADTVLSDIYDQDDGIRDAFSKMYKNDFKHEDYADYADKTIGDICKMFKEPLFPELIVRQNSQRIEKYETMK